MTDSLVSLSCTTVSLLHDFLPLIQRRKSISTCAKPGFPWWQQQPLASPKYDRIMAHLVWLNKSNLFDTHPLFVQTGWVFWSNIFQFKGWAQSEVEKGLWADSVLLVSPTGLFVGWPGCLVSGWWASLRGKPTRRGLTWGAPCLWSLMLSLCDKL